MTYDVYITDHFAFITTKKTFTLLQDAINYLNEHFIPYYPNGTADIFRGKHQYIWIKTIDGHVTWCRYKNNKRILLGK